MRSRPSASSSAMVIRPLACMRLKQRLTEALSMPMMRDTRCAEIEFSIASSIRQRQISMPTSNTFR